MSGGDVDPGGERLSGGELNAAITREIVKIHTAGIGRGPRKSYSFHNGDALVTVLIEVLTQAERTLIAYGESDSVREARHLSQRAMADQMVAAVERLTARRVVAFMSDNHLDPDMAVEVFILDSPLG